MLANMTAGYADFVLGNEEFDRTVYQDPFRQWTTQDQLAMSLDKPHVYPPGTNWNYAHTDYVILGQVLEKITGKPVDQLIQEDVLTPLGLTNTEGFATPEIPEPVLHAFSSERR